MTYVFQPMIENISEDYWGHCPKDQRQDFIKYNKEFTMELEESINCLYKEAKECNLDRVYYDQLGSEIDKGNYL